jgi:DNA-binding response OmpR family regulator
MMSEANRTYPLKVLVVDDDEGIRSVMAAMLDDRGYDVRVVDITEAHAVVSADWAPDVALVDLAMPGEDGSEYATWLKGVLPETRIVIYSAQPDTGRFARLVQEIGADAWLDKPFELHALYAKIEEH